MAYLLDANAFIEAKKGFYAFDICPGYWEWIKQAHRTGTVLSVEKVRDELAGGGHELTAWAKDVGVDFFLAPNLSSLQALSKLSMWALGQDFTTGAVNKFFASADYYLVAQALAGGHTVVTLEKASNEKGRIKIPVACQAFGVQCITPFDMLRTERAHFVLSRR